ncbi:MAG: hypothetical protein H5U03_01555 [Clostridia bacterium]|nr:hypothetical protein [Clostridia bacterium]
MRYDHLYRDSVKAGAVGVRFAKLYGRQKVDHEAFAELGRARRPLRET